MRAFIKKYERSFMLGLVIVLLVIFTVAGDIVATAQTATRGGTTQDDVAGSFRTIPGKGEKVEITFGEFSAAQQQVRVANAFRNSRETPSATEVWTHILLTETAKRIGLTVSNGELVDILNAMFRGQPTKDRETYKLTIKRNFRMGVYEFEEAVRSMVVAKRVRDLYRESFEIAPPASRVSLGGTIGDQPEERVNLSYGVLDASRFIDAARKAYEEDKKAEETLKAYFDKDAAVQSEGAGFRHPRRYKVEMLYCLHHLVTKESYPKIEALFKRAYPQLDMAKLEETVKEEKDYFGYYTDRLLDLIGSSWEKVKKDNPEKKPDPKDPNAQNPDIVNQRQVWKDRGYELAEPQIDRELRVRGMFRWFKDEALKDQKVSLKGPLRPPEEARRSGRSDRQQRDGQGSDRVPRA